MKTFFNAKSIVTRFERDGRKASYRTAELLEFKTWQRHSMYSYLKVHSNSQIQAMISSEKLGNAHGRIVVMF